MSTPVLGSFLSSASHPHERQESFSPTPTLMGSHALNIVRRKGSVALRRQKYRVKKQAATKDNKTVDLVDFSQNALCCVNNSDPTQVTNAHQLRAVKSNPHANNVMSRKKMKQLRKRLVVRDSASGKLKHMIFANTMDA